MGRSCIRTGRVPLTVMASGVTAFTAKVAFPSWTSSSHCSGSLVGLAPLGQKLSWMPATVCEPSVSGYCSSPPLVPETSCCASVGISAWMKSSPDRVTRSVPAFAMMLAESMGLTSGVMPHPEQPLEQPPPLHAATSSTPRMSSARRAY